MDWENEVERIIEGHWKELPVTQGGGWLETAIEQKNAHLTVSVAYTELLVYDQLDRLLLTTIISN